MLASAFSTEIGRLRDAGAAATGAGATAPDGATGMAVDGTAEAKTEVDRGAVCCLLFLLLSAPMNGGVCFVLLYHTFSRFTT